MGYWKAALVLLLCTYPAYIILNPIGILFFSPMYKIKNYFKEWYQPHESFVVITPLFPAETFFNWKANADNDLITSKETLRRSLRQFYQQPLVQEALYVGSPDLHEQLLLWIE